MGGAGSFEALVSFKVPLAATDASAVVVEFGLLAFPDGFGPDLLHLSPPASGEWVSLVGLGGGAIALPLNPCKDMVVGIGLHGGHHTLLPRKWMTDRNTTTSTIFRNVRQSNTSPPFWHLCPTEMVRITITTMNLPSKSLQELCQWS